MDILPGATESVGGLRLENLWLFGSGWLPLRGSVDS